VHLQTFGGRNSVAKHQQKRWINMEMQSSALGRSLRQINKVDQEKYFNGYLEERIVIKNDLYIYLNT
jgi:hypothetical protein